MFPPPFMFEVQYLYLCSSTSGSSTEFLAKERSSKNWLPYSSVLPSHSHFPLFPFSAPNPLTPFPVPVRPLAAEENLYFPGECSWLPAAAHGSPLWPLTLEQGPGAREGGLLQSVPRHSLMSSSHIFSLVQTQVHFSSSCPLHTYIMNRKYKNTYFRALSVRPQCIFRLGCCT